jgi:osmotically-inducible protein OsmY
MATGATICPQCGTELRSDTTFCPRCGTARTGELLESGERVLRGGMRLPTGPLSPSGPSLEQQLVFLSPPDEGRRFPLFTRYRVILLIAAAFLALFLLLIGYFVWQKQKRDDRQAMAVKATPAAALPMTGPPPSLSPSPTPTPIDDQKITESVKAALTAYNPVGRYVFVVKGGLVTLNGEALNPPERDGAENVVRPLPGVTGVINLMTIKADPLRAGMPGKMSDAETKRFEEAIRLHLQESPADDQEAIRKEAEAKTKRDADLRAREAASNQAREEDAATKKAAAERLERETAEYNRLQNEQRDKEAARRIRAEQARLEMTSLKSGTIAWSGIVGGIDEVVLAGSSASVRHVEGDAVREAKVSFSAPLPRAPTTIKILSASGRGKVDVTQQPAADNGYTAIVRINDTAKGGEKRCAFTLRWDAQ